MAETTGLKGFQVIRPRERRSLCVLYLINKREALKKSPHPVHERLSGGIRRLQNEDQKP